MTLLMKYLNKMSVMEELPELLLDINIPFKISAGPGAGKTTWLVKHVQNVLRNSNLLNKTQKIACITYTRIGAETVNKGVKKLSGTHRVEIGTIHSFLYHNIVKPFSYLIKYDDLGNELFNIDELNGHIENRLIWDRLRSWKSEIESDNNKKYDYFNWTNNRSLLISKLGCIDYCLDENNNINTVFHKNAYKYNVAIPTTNNELLKYKKTYWRKGIMHHEDVFFFTYNIFMKNPRSIEFLSNKFPYLFIDEFQDTNPLQTWVLNEIQNQGTVIGVIGDPAQSIFEFAGARRKDFDEFTVPGIKLFKASINYRSTKKIVDFLKCMRDDIEQKPKDDREVGDDVTVLVGDEHLAIEHVRNFDVDNYSILCRWNKDVNRLRKNIRKVEDENLINLLYAEDSNHRRPVFIHSLIKAFDFYDNQEYSEAIKEIKKIFRGTRIEGIAKRKFAIEIIEYLNSNSSNSIEVIYKHWHPILTKNYGVTLAGLSKTKSIHKKPFIDFIPHLSKETKISSKIRTIHQAKGDEFKNVLVCLFEKIDKNGKVTKKIDSILTDYIFNAINNIKLDSEVGEETRLVYVACSRAMERLFIYLQELSNSDENRFKSSGMIVKRLS